jgi:hypothetical protein
MFVHFSLLKKAEWCSTAQHATTKPKKTCFKPPSLNDSQHEPTIMESMANKKSLNALRVNEICCSVPGELVDESRSSISSRIRVSCSFERCCGMISYRWLLASLSRSRSLPRSPSTESSATWYLLSSWVPQKSESRDDREVKNAVHLIVMPNTISRVWGIMTVKSRQSNIILIVATIASRMTPTIESFWAHTLHCSRWVTSNNLPFSFSRRTASLCAVKVKKSFIVEGMHPIRPNKLWSWAVSVWKQTVIAYYVRRKERSVKKLYCRLIQLNRTAPRTS